MFFYARLLRNLRLYKFASGNIGNNSLHRAELNHRIAL